MFLVNIARRKFFDEILNENGFEMQGECRHDFVVDMGQRGTMTKPVRDRAAGLDVMSYLPTAVRGLSVR